MIITYTLKTCDTCKKALKWLDGQSIGHINHDIRADGLPLEAIEEAVSQLGWEAVLNRRSTTWRNLDDSEKTELDAHKAIALIAMHPTLLKRPLFLKGNQYFCGFNETIQSELKA